MPIIKEDPLRRYDPDGFDFKSMKGEVSEAMQFDWKRDKIDDAKKRAITDSKCYDEFKDRVAGCTLKPIHRSEFNAPPKYSFNNRVAGYSEKPVVLPLGSNSQDVSKAASLKQTSERSLGSDSTASAEKVPRNGHEFERELRRRSTAEEKVRLIEIVLDRSGLVARLFSRELDGEMLRQVLVAFEEVLDRGTAPRGISRRFFVALAVDCPVSITAACSFFDAEERDTIARLLAREPASDPGDDVRVCAAFGIPVSRVAEAAAALPATAEVSPPLRSDESVTEELVVATPSVGTTETEKQVAQDAGYEGMD
jgi:hypothetical protein